MSPIGKKKPTRSSSPIVRELFEAIDATGLPYSAVAQASGVHVVTLSKWRRGENAPRWIELENVAKAIGYVLRLEKVA